MSKAENKASLLCVCVLVAQLCLTLCDPVDCIPLGSSDYEISQARMLEWVAIPFSRGSSWPRGRIHISCIAGRFFIIWATREASNILLKYQRRHRNRTDCRVQKSICWSTILVGKPPNIFFMGNNWRVLKKGGRTFHTHWLNRHCK